MRAAERKNLLIIGASARQCLEAGLIDEILVHVAPILLGDGVRFFARSSMPRAGTPPGMKEDILEKSRPGENGRPVMNMSVSPKLSPGTRLHRQLSLFSRST
ncbi:dihydrofolate reductase family protein [Ktedonobacter robiniae]|uniref:dihydrofolate reductase family protein n=1 Tax=Ktedonobacter robiniae TaxID=2778365 RepID=UPI001F361A77|nr:dihydrofolate reductase family protein [Ktedonobacter robiniae]